MIDHPSGHGQLFIGKDAYRRFNAIANRCLKARSDGDSRVSDEHLARVLRKEFSRGFLRNGLDVKRGTVGAMIDAVWQDLVGCFEERTHIPCSIVEEKDPEEFVVEPVRFMKSGMFLQRYREEIQRERDVTTAELAER